MRKKVKNALLLFLLRIKHAAWIVHPSEKEKIYTESWLYNGIEFFKLFLSFYLCSAEIFWIFAELPFERKLMNFESYAFIRIDKSIWLQSEYVSMVEESGSSVVATQSKMTFSVCFKSQHMDSSQFHRFNFW